MKTKIDFAAAPKPEIEFPVLMQCKHSNCVKLFVNNTDGVIVTDDAGNTRYEISSAKESSPRNTKPVPADGGYWQKFGGVITLSNHESVVDAKPTFQSDHERRPFIARDDVREGVKHYVRGYLELAEERNEQFTETLAELRFRIYIDDVTKVVIAYLEGRKTLDGSCSDTVCHLAHKCETIFGKGKP